MPDNFLACSCLQFLIPDGMDAITIGPWTIIRPELSTNPIDIAHEQVHQRQFAKYGIVFDTRYVTEPHFRLSAEAMAYAAGLAAAPADEQPNYRMIFAGLLTGSGYNLLGNELTEAEIENAFDEAIAGEELI